MCAKHRDNAPLIKRTGPNKSAQGGFFFKENKRTCSCIRQTRVCNLLAQEKCVCGIIAKVVARGATKKDGFMVVLYTSFLQWCLNVAVSAMHE